MMDVSEMRSMLFSCSLAQRQRSKTDDVYQYFVEQENRSVHSNIRLAYMQGIVGYTV